MNILLNISNMDYVNNIFYLICALIIAFSFFLNVYLLLELSEIKYNKNLEVQSTKDWIKEEVKQKRIYHSLSDRLINERDDFKELYYEYLDKFNRSFQLLKNKKK